MRILEVSYKNSNCQVKVLVISCQKRGIYCAYIELISNL
jgi:hypothetical protein